MAWEVCSGGGTISVFRNRTNSTTAISRLCVPKLKTNSVHGVLDSGRSENRTCGEAENPLFILLAPALRTPVYWQKFRLTGRSKPGKSDRRTREILHGKGHLHQRFAG